jgi:hypothetical protein
MPTVLVLALLLTGCAKLAEAAAEPAAEPDDRYGYEDVDEPGLCE